MVAEGAAVIERLDAVAAREVLPALVEILRDEVDGGAPVNFLTPLSVGAADPAGLPWARTSRERHFRSQYGRWLQRRPLRM